MSLVPCTVCRSILPTNSMNGCLDCGSLYCEQCPAETCLCVHDDAVIQAARVALRTVHMDFHDLRVKEAVQGLTATEGQEYQALGVRCIRARQIVDAFIDAEDGEFSEPFDYLPYAA
jgi:hypothetical protein